LGGSIPIKGTRNWEIISSLERGVWILGTLNFPFPPFLGIVNFFKGLKEDLKIRAKKGWI